MDWLGIAATSAVVSAAVAGGFTLINSHLQRETETKRRMAEMAMKMAILEWEHHVKIAQQQQGGASISPPEIYLYRYSKLLPLMENNKMTPDNIAKLHSEVESYAARNHAHMEKRRKNI